MKAIILAGGHGTRLSEETQVRPKPMVEIGNKPILWHIMKIYSFHGVNEFIICCGYKGEIIKEYFANYYLHQSDVTFDMENNEMKVHHNKAEPWKVTLVNTGLNTMTGGRIKRVKELIGGEPFHLTYGDGVSNIDIGKLVDFHKSNDMLATLTAVQPPGRFGTFTLKKEQTVIKNFREKPKDDSAWVNGGFFVLEPKVIDYITDDSTVWEQEPLTRLANEGQLGAYRHHGFWQPMDTLRDKMYLESKWEEGAPWRIWK
ncbi:glucose-1-phosphate cytidylyltransferase [Rhodohalobacter sp. SW132]|uniref:glucose-1-phosphate cytidylyltransferase n=1 Tax=Rhodohalobacter sp. SW132 TaxID=2293433 RepID=UPI000E2401BF|nr:glucose-1-phosphate cytidylyltransferase [Rhodohalobacter sp. SW132]REL24180.1 glucose-1-phosphate cytidylyltransferase [Rhodohalobacter sp. SW132]